MQDFQDQKQVNEGRFNEIDQRWTRVQEALRVQNKQRTQDAYLLNHQLKDHNQVTSTLQNKKIEVIQKKLHNLQTVACEIKENLGQLFEDQATFRVDHLDQKNAFIQTYTQGSNNFNRSMQQYSTNRMNDLAKKLDNADATKMQKTQAVLTELKEDVIGSAKDEFKKEKERQLQLLNKISDDSNKELERIRNLVRGGQKQKQDSQNKLKLMIQSLVEQLGKACEQEQREGQTTYDSLLKTLEECCDRIQQAQLR